MSQSLHPILEGHRGPFPRRLSDHLHRDAGGGAGAPPRGEGGRGGAQEPGAVVGVDRLRRWRGGPDGGRRPGRHRHSGRQRGAVPVPAARPPPVPQGSEPDPAAAGSPARGDAPPPILRDHRARARAAGRAGEGRCGDRSSPPQERRAARRAGARLSIGEGGGPSRGRGLCGALRAGAGARGGGPRLPQGHGAAEGPRRGRPSDGGRGEEERPPQDRRPRVQRAGGGPGRGGWAGRAQALARHPAGGVRRRGPQLRAPAAQGLAPPGGPGLRQVAFGQGGGGALEVPAPPARRRRAVLGRQRLARGGDAGGDQDLRRACRRSSSGSTRSRRGSSSPTRTRAPPACSAR